MKKFDKTYQQIITKENLLLAWEKFQVGKTKKNDVIIFQTKLIPNLLDLYKELKEKKYTHDVYHAFNISDPKPRNIHKATVRDRAVHHLLYKELYPFFDEKFIYDSYSCRQNKGTHRALKQFEIFSRKVSKNYTKQCFVLKCDIRKFFASINHHVLKETLSISIQDKDLVLLLHKVIDSFSTEGRDGVGLPLGNLTSQLLVNIYMNRFDQFAKHSLKTKYYIRYADDFVFLSNDSEYLKGLISKISLFLHQELKLSLHPNKVSIQTIYSGVDFLGWVHFAKHKVLRTTTKRKMIRNLSGEPKEETKSSYAGLLSHGNTYKLKNRLKI